MKRAFDLAVTIAAAPVWLPLMAVVAVLVAVKLGRPIFFVQRRPGKDETIFTLVKFRTMTDARDSGAKLLPDGARLTAFGRWLRITSFDELPELWNVLKGDMSLVGPRPLLVEYLPRYNTRQRRRHEVRPGVTGLAQVMGRNAISWEEKLEWDVRYVETRSLRLDFTILGRTIGAVIRREGVSAPGEATMPEFTGNGVRRPEP